MKRYMIIILSIVGLIALVSIIEKLHLTNQFSKEVKQLSSQSNSISNNTFRNEMLINLPEPAQRYFKHVLKNGQTYISYVRLRHEGQFKTNQNN